MVVEPLIVATRVHAAGGAEVDLVVPHELRYLRGHFPGAPIVPGVVQIKWAIVFARKLLQAGGEFAGMKAVKFLELMHPGDTATLKLDYSPADGELRFSFESGRARYSNGRLLLRRAP
jgi:3-hydroxymyristoyl/3-hydroxydecanoyl-(acyl carrier protein) dehydratase